MYFSIPIFLSSITLYLLATTTTPTNGYPIRSITSHINKTHVPFPIFLHPGSVHAIGLPSTNTLEGRSANNIVDKVKQLFTTVTTAVTQAEQKIQQAVENKFHRIGTKTAAATHAIAVADTETPAATVGIQGRDLSRRKGVPNPLFALWAKILRPWGYKPSHPLPGGSVGLPHARMVMLLPVAEDGAEKGKGKEKRM